VDIVGQLKGKIDADVVFLPENAFRADTEIMLDGMTLDEVIEKINNEGIAKFLEELNTRVKLPASGGYWEGVPGDGTWFSDDPLIKALTENKGIKYINGRPDFSPYSEAKVPFDLGDLNGTKSDLSKACEKIMEDHIEIAGKSDFKSVYEVRRWLSTNNLTPHHNSIIEILITPTEINGGIPHVGSASDLRLFYELIIKGEWK
jgi:hypothetical protein